MNQSEFLAIPVTCSKHTKNHVTMEGEIGFASHSLKNWSKILNSIPKHGDCNNCVITFDGHLQTALLTSPITTVVKKLS